MATLKLNGHCLIVKYLYQNHGLPYFQMRIPQELQARFDGKTKLSIGLKPQDGPPVIQVQRLAKKYKALFRAFREDPSMSTTDTKEAAFALLRRHGLESGDGNKRATIWPRQPEYNDQPHLDGLLDELIELDRDRPLGQAAQLAFKALGGQLPVTLSEVLQIYFENHPKGTDKEYIKKVSNYWSKLLSFLGDMALNEMKREHAKRYVRHRLQQGVRCATVQKELNIYRAVIERGRLELELGIKNPFAGITIPQQAGSESVPREAFTLEEHKLLVERAIAMADDIRLIVLICALTGCRIGEVVGLRLIDLRLSEPFPYFTLKQYGKGSLKTANSQRPIPILPLLKQVVLAHVNRLEVSEKALFPRYNNLIDAPDAKTASRTVSKWIGSLGVKKSSHSFRHSVVGLFRESSVPKELWEEITGHARQRMSDRYGEPTSNEKKFKALEEALLPLTAKLQSLPLPSKHVA